MLCYGFENVLVFGFYQFFFLNFENVLLNVLVKRFLKLSINLYATFQEPLGVFALIIISILDSKTVQKLDEKKWSIYGDLGSTVCILTTNFDSMRYKPVSLGCYVTYIP